MQPVDGILVIDKPEGITSHDVVARVRRILQTRRVGHTGTLDPFATGVMVILVGKATRLARFFDKDEKEYRAVLKFGFESDTGDKKGKLRKVGNAEMTEIDRGALEKAMRSFVGETEQTPPMYSAKKVEGKKLYELARKGIEVERKAVRIRISELELVELGPETTAAIRVVCSAGTYIRTLAEDIGRALGSGAYLETLQRTRAGKFDISSSVMLDNLKTEESPMSFVLPVLSALEHLPSVILNAERVKRTLNGLSSRTDRKFENGEAVLMVSDDRELIAVGYYKSSANSIQPKVVLG